MWLQSSGFEATYKKEPYIVIGSLKEEMKLKQGLDSPYEITELGLIVVTEESLGYGLSLHYFSSLRKWRLRKKERRTVVVAPRQISEIDLLAFREADQVVRWPTSVYPPS